MAQIAQFGSGGAVLPITTGKIFWVAPSDSYVIEGRRFTATNDQDGRTPDRAIRTINSAMSRCTADKGDIIVLLPGTHTPANTSGTATSLAASVAGVTIMGLPVPNPQNVGWNTTIGPVTGDQCINVTAADVEIAYVNIIPVTTHIAVDFSADANNLYIHDCYIDLNTPGANVNTIGIAALGAASHVKIENCVFESDGAQGPALDMTATLKSRVTKCRFYNTAGTWAAAIKVGAATDSLQIDRSLFTCYGTAMTTAIDGAEATVASGVVIHDNRFGKLVTVPVDNFDAGEAEISENYDFGVGATDGGVLITAIT